MIGVIGGTGNVGGLLVERLVRAGQEVVAVSLAGAPEGREASASVRHVKGDVTRPPTIEVALRGSNAVFLLVATEAHEGVDPLALIAAIERAGAERIVVLSSMGAHSRPEAEAYEGLRHLERAARTSSRQVTILRPTGFASNTLGWSHGVRIAREVLAPFADVGVPIVDPADIAAVAAITLLEPGHDGVTYDLTGPQPITPREQAFAISAALGTPIGFREVSRAEAAEMMRPHMPTSMVEATLDILGMPNEIERRLSPDVERVLGRAAAPYATWLQRNVAAFR